MDILHAGGWRTTGEGKIDQFNAKLFTYQTGGCFKSWILDRNCAAEVEGILHDVLFRSFLVVAVNHLVSAAPRRFLFFRAAVRRTAC